MELPANLHVFLLLCALLAAPSFGARSLGGEARAATPVEVAMGPLELSLGRTMELFEDPTGALTLERVVAAGDGLEWFRSEKESPGFGFTRSAYWVRVQFSNPTRHMIPLILEVGYPLTDYITWSRPGPDGTYQSLTVGDQVPFGERPMAYRNFGLPFRLAAGAVETHYLRFETTSAMTLPLTLWDPQGLTEKINREQTILGAYYGTMIVMLIYNFMLFASLRDRGYLYYVLFLSGFLVIQLNFTGLSSEWLWPNNTWLANYSLPILIFGTIALAAQFTRVFLSVAATMPKTDRIFKAGMALAAVGSIASIFAPLSVSIIVADLLALVLCVTMMSTGFKSLHAGFRPARYYVIAWSAMLVGVIVFLLKVFGVLPEVFLTQWAIHFGSALEVVLFSLGLADRIKIVEREREQARNEAFAVKGEALEAQIKLTRAYERFVPHELLDFLEKESILDVKLGDNVEREMTVLFSDIRSFTNLSESMTPEENFRFINSYLKRMQPLIEKNHGFIDKYIGDAVMALFDRRSDDALDSALEMLRNLEDYNEHRMNSGYSPVSIGIGLNRGKLMMGTIGGEERMEGTVISDAVNLSSRIETMTKVYRTPLLISEHVFFALEDPTKYSVRFIDRVIVKGKGKPVIVYEVFDADNPYLLEGKRGTTVQFEEGWWHYHHEEWDDARKRFEECVKAVPDDHTARYYVERCKQALERDEAPEEGTADGKM